jgi:hypothetical protein
MTKEERGLEDTCSMMEHWKNSMKTAVFWSRTYQETL